MGVGDSCGLRGYMGGSRGQSVVGILRGVYRGLEGCVRVSCGCRRMESSPSCRVAGGGWGSHEWKG